MRDDPRKNLKWLEQELLASERPAAPDELSEDTADLLAQVDQLLEEIQEPDPPAFAQKRKKTTKGQQAEREYIQKHLGEPTAVLTKTKKQLRRETKLQKQAEKKANVNRNIKGLVFLAILEILGILVLLGWWLQ